MNRMKKLHWLFLMAAAIALSAAAGGLLALKGAGYSPATQLPQPTVFALLFGGVMFGIGIVSGGIADKPKLDSN